MVEENYDVVVIGSGLGGLTAATLLTRRGYRVLVVESRTRIGGRFSSFKHEGFTLTTGAIVLHTGGWVVKLMEEMEIDLDQLRPISRLFYRIHGRDHEIPHEGRLRIILDLIDTSEKESAQQTGRAFKEVAVGKILAGLKEAMAGDIGEGILTLRDWLLQYTENEMAHEVFDQLSVSLLMAHAWELPVNNFFQFLSATGGMRDFYMASKGNLNIAKYAKPTLSQTINFISQLRREQTQILKIHISSASIV